MTRTVKTRLLALFAAGCFVAACTASQGATAVASIPADIALVQCVLSTYGTDSAAGMNPAAIASDELAKCGSDGATVASILDAHEAANAKQGIVAKSPGAVGQALRGLDAGH